MSKRSTKSSDESVIVDEISGLSKSFTTLIVKNITNDKKKYLDRIVNNDPRRKRKSSNPKKDIIEDLNLC
jgi:hypothetical protein